MGSGCGYHGQKLDLECRDRSFKVMEQHGWDSLRLVV